MRLKKYILTLLCLVFLACYASGQKPVIVSLVSQTPAHPRISFGIKKLADVLEKAGYKITMSGTANGSAGADRLIVVAVEKDALTEFASLTNNSSVKKPGKEGFTISSGKNNSIVI